MNNDFIVKQNQVTCTLKILMSANMVLGISEISDRGIMCLIEMQYSKDNSLYCLVAACLHSSMDNLMSNSMIVKTSSY